MRVAISLAAVSLLVAAQAVDAQNVHTVAVHGFVETEVAGYRIATANDEAFIVESRTILRSMQRAPSALRSPAISSA